MANRSRFVTPKVATEGGTVYPGTDNLIITNYGARNVLVMGVGIAYSGPVAQYSVCDIWYIYPDNRLHGIVNWGDDGSTTQMTFDDPHNKPRIARTVKTPTQVGVFAVTAQIWGICADAWRHHDVSNTVIGEGSVYVYDSVPITNFQVLFTSYGSEGECPDGFCGAPPPGASIVGGNQASALSRIQFHLLIQ